MTPLVLIVILTNKEGVTFYGEYAVLYSLLAVFIIISDLGFSMEIPKRIIRNRNDSNKISEIISIYFFIKFAFSLILSFLIYFFIPYDFPIKIIIILCLVLKAIDLEIIFIGLEKYGFIAKTNFIIKLTYLASVIIIDLSESGIMKIFIIHFFVTMIGFVIYYKKIFFDYKYRLNKLSFNYSIRILRSSLEFYFARFFNNLYMQGSTYIISYMITIDLIAIYSIALNFYKAGLSIIGGVGRVLYTHLIRTKDFEVLKSTTKTSIVIQACLFPIVIIFGGHFLALIFTFDIYLLFVLSKFLYSSLVFSIINSYWGYPLFTAINCDRIVHFCNISSAVSYYVIFSYLFMFKEITIINAVLCIIAADFFGALLKLIFAINKKIIP